MMEIQCSKYTFAGIKLRNLGKPNSPVCQERKIRGEYPHQRQRHWKSWDNFWLSQYCQNTVLLSPGHLPVMWGDYSWGQGTLNSKIGIMAELLRSSGPDNQSSNGHFNWEIDLPMDFSVGRLTWQCTFYLADRSPNRLFSWEINLPMDFSVGRSISDEQKGRSR